MSRSSGDKVGASEPGWGGVRGGCWSEAGGKVVAVAGAESSVVTAKDCIWIGEGVKAHRSLERRGQARLGKALGAL